MLTMASYAVKIGTEHVTAHLHADVIVASGRNTVPVNPVTCFESSALAGQSAEIHDMNMARDRHPRNKEHNATMLACSCNTDDNDGAEYTRTSRQKNHDKNPRRKLKLSCGYCIMSLIVYPIPLTRARFCRLLVQSLLQ